MSGFDELGCEDEIGFDFLSMIPMAGGLISAAAGGGKGGGGGGQESAAAAAERQRLQDEKDRAQRSATTWKIVGISILALLGLGGVAFVVSRGNSGAK